MRSRSRVSFPSTSGRFSVRAAARFAGLRSRATPKTFARRTTLRWNCFPTIRCSRAGSSSRSERVQFQGLPARICWLGYGERAEFGEAMNDMVRTGKLEAPIVIGRDHLDTGSVASPLP